ncbi:hypothetical protein KKA53_01355 [Candidatus Dependentiae bacterium]|nr:hypothetical protein [Candidatus Dependentiae bacterium]
MKNSYILFIFSVLFLSGFGTNLTAMKMRSPFRTKTTLTITQQKKTPLNQLVFLCKNRPINAKDKTKIIRFYQELDHILSNAMSLDKETIAETFNVTLCNAIIETGNISIKTGTKEDENNKYNLDPETGRLWKTKNYATEQETKFSYELQKILNLIEELEASIIELLEKKVLSGSEIKKVFEYLFRIKTSMPTNLKNEFGFRGRGKGNNGNTSKRVTIKPKKSPIKFFYKPKNVTA